LDNLKLHPERRTNLSEEAQPSEQLHMGSCR
jgi:hypothetical protein